MIAGMYDILFEPVKIGPVTTRNRFYQVPHCTGMGHRYPQAEAKLREVKAQGGWGVVSTQETEIHPTSDMTPANEGRLWDDSDIASLHLMTESVHRHGSLTAIQLVHNGLHASNRYSRQLPLAPSAATVDTNDPVQARAMDKADIVRFRQWHVQAAKRAKQAGFDIVYVYAGHDMALLQHFLLHRHNHRTDEYGGSFENRLRLFREVIADTKDAVGDCCAIAVRLAVDELLGDEGIRHDVEAREIIAALAEEPDLWDVNLSGWANDSQTSRFAEQGYQEPYTQFVKSVTTKPVVGVGRYTSPDTMVRLVRSGHLDLIGAARPSIADPYLPEKVQAGRQDDIRECIGCNICVSGDNTSVPMRCTQNPTIGEEWRLNWHPESVPMITKRQQHLVVGGGPAGLEAARALVQGGADVVIAEASEYWGGRVTLESQLPGLGEWARVRDWRFTQLQRSASASMYLDSSLDCDAILNYNIANIVLATGAQWRTDGVGRAHRRALPFLLTQNILSPDSLLNGGLEQLEPNRNIIVFDDDRFYIASALAELVAGAGHHVTIVTPASVISPWAEHTLEQERIQRRLLELNINLMVSHRLADMSKESLTTECTLTGRTSLLPCDKLLMVTSRTPGDTLWNQLTDRKAEWADARIQTVTRIGDCLAPGLIAAAVYGGHQYAREALSGTNQSARREDN